MTHADIFEKFLIEYDKANITTSFPSLTDYEIATVLDKAYNALLAQKFTGVNIRRAGFEADAKAIEDVRPLITRESNLPRVYNAQGIATNEYVFKMPDDMRYFIEGSVTYSNSGDALDNKPHVYYNMLLTSHTIANGYKSSATNMPWIKDPVCYLEDDNIHVLVDPYVRAKHGSYTDNNDQTVEIPIVCNIVYLKKPNTFVSDYEDKDTEFELNEQMAEELISLAITFSVEIVESSRINTRAVVTNLEP